MKKIYLAVCFYLFMSYSCLTQCEDGRYRDKIFPLVDVQTDIPYGQNFTYAGVDQELLLDVYKPSGDSENSRPVVIMAHGGYFLGGNKGDDSVAPICTDLAKMGYVTASISYRLGVPVVMPLDGPFMEAILRAVQDMRAAIRFFRKSVEENGNPYGINPDEIYVGGVSAGGFIALHLAYLDEGEIPANINTSNPGLGGGIEGNSGNAGYSSEVKAILSIAGAIGDKEWIEEGNLPAFLAHGSEDTVVPFASDTLNLFGLFDIAEVDGSSSIAARLEDLDINHCFEIYWGQDHVPQQNLELYFDTTLSIVSNFLSHYVCPSIPLDCEYRGLLASVDEEMQETDLIIYPNPSSSYVYLSDKEARILGIKDATGKNIAIKQSRSYLDIQDLRAGVYLLEIEKKGRRFTRKLVVN